MAELVHLVRHGEADNPEELVYGRLPGFGLSPRGRFQAEEVARHLAGRELRGVYSSPLERARQTAAAIATPHRLEVSCLPELTEWSLGQRWQGVRWDELDRRFPGELQAYLDAPSDLPFSPESLADLGRRVAGAAQAVARRHTGGEVALVSHQDPIQAARLILTGRSLYGLHEEKPGLGWVVTLRPGRPWREVGMWAPPGSG